MAIYHIINPSIKKLDELARLAHNIRFLKRQFQKTLGSDEHTKMELAEQELDEWLKKNVDFNHKK